MWKALLLAHRAFWKALEYHQEYHIFITYRWFQDSFQIFSWFHCLNALHCIPQYTDNQPRHLSSQTASERWWEAFLESSLPLWLCRPGRGAPHSSPFTGLQGQLQGSLLHLSLLASAAVAFMPQVTQEWPYGSCHLDYGSQPYVFAQEKAGGWGGGGRERLATDYCTALSKGRDEGQDGFCNAFSATAKHLSAELRGDVTEVKNRQPKENKTRGRALAFPAYDFLLKLLLRQWPCILLQVFHFNLSVIYCLFPMLQCFSPPQHFCGWATLPVPPLWLSGGISRGKSRGFACTSVPTSAVSSHADRRPWYKST